MKIYRIIVEVMVKGEDQDEASDNIWELLHQKESIVRHETKQIEEWE